MTRQNKKIGPFIGGPEDTRKKKRLDFADLGTILTTPDNVDLVIVTAHSATEQGIPKQFDDFRAGNFSDLLYVPQLIVSLCRKLRKGLGKKLYELDVKMLPDVYLSQEDAKSHNLLLLGAANVNCVTRKVFERYWSDKKSLPIRFKDISDHEVIVSWVGDKREHTRVIEREIKEDYAILEMVTNPWNHNKVVILCCGTGLWGTQAGILALTGKADSKGTKLGNNEFDKNTPGKVLKVCLEEKELKSFRAGKEKFSLKVWNDFEFIE